MLTRFGFSVVAVISLMIAGALLYAVLREEKEEEQNPFFVATGMLTTDSPTTAAPQGNASGPRVAILMTGFARSFLGKYFFFFFFFCLLPPLTSHIVSRPRSSGKYPRVPV